MSPSIRALLLVRMDVLESKEQPHLDSSARLI